MADFSLIIITWNAKHFLEKCLDSIYNKNKGFEFELVMVDNNSTDGTREFVENKYPETVYIYNDSNKGVAPARNQGLSIAKGKYKLILDVDTELLTENAFAKLVDFMESNKEVGIIGAKLMFSNDELQHTCLKFPSVGVKVFTRLGVFGGSKMLREYYMFDFDHNSIKEVDYVIGAFQLLRSQMLEKIGLYDDKIFYGPEDIDYCLRARRAGYKTVYFPEVKLYHFYQRITKKFFTKITILHIKGLIHFILKHKYIIYPKY